MRRLLAGLFNGHDRGAWIATALIAAVFLLLFNVAPARAGSGGIVPECLAHGRMAYVFTHDYLARTGFDPEKIKFNYQINPEANRPLYDRYESYRLKAIENWKAAIAYAEENSIPIVADEIAQKVFEACGYKKGQERVQPQADPTAGLGDAQGRYYANCVSRCKSKKGVAK